MEGYQEVNEIDLIDLMFYCLKKWRWIIICATFFSIIAGLYKYQVTVKDNQIKKDIQKNQSVAKHIEGEESNELIVFADPFSSAITFGVIGMVAGVCIICLIFSMRYTVSGKLQNESNFQKKFGMPLLGVVRRSQTKKKIFGFVDRWISRLEEGPYAKISRNEQIKIAAVNIYSAINKNSERKIKRIMLAGTVASNDVVEICNQLIVEIDDVTFSPYRQVVFHATALKKLEYYEGIVFIEVKGKSNEKLIRKEMEYAYDRNVKILGTIIC